MLVIFRDKKVNILDKRLVTPSLIIIQENDMQYVCEMSYLREWVK